eukprot:Colp12_sorted_trinity150504_noHs@16729
MASFDYAHDIVSDEDIQFHENVYNREREKAGRPSVQASFNYAYCLIRSKYEDDIRHGIRILLDLSGRDNGSQRREYTYYLAFAYYRLEEYTEAKEYVTMLLYSEPNNRQANELKQAIEYKIQKDGILGLAIVGGAVAAIGLLAAALAKKK